MLVRNFFGVDPSIQFWASVRLMPYCFHRQQAILGPRSVSVSQDHRQPVVVGVITIITTVIQHERERKKNNASLRTSTSRSSPPATNPTKDDICNTKNSRGESQRETEPNPSLSLSSSRLSLFRFRSPLPFLLVKSTDPRTGARQIHQTLLHLLVSTRKNTTVSTKPQNSATDKNKNTPPSTPPPPPTTTPWPAPSKPHASPPEERLPVSR